MTDFGTNQTAEFNFLHFNNNSAQKEKRKQELNLEYREFKEKDNQKFRNRFLNKNIVVRKLNESILNDNECQPDKTKCQPTSRNSANNLQDSIEGLKTTFMLKLDDLQNTVDELKRTKSDYLESDHNLVNPPLEHQNVVPERNYLPRALSFTHKSQEHRNLTRGASEINVNILDEAEHKLYELENIFNQLKENHKFDRRTIQAHIRPDVRAIENSNISRNNANTSNPDDECNIKKAIIAPKMAVEDKYTKHRLFHLYDDYETRQEKLKNEKNEYAQALQQQIVDVKRRKEEQRLKELEEDNRKVAEMQNFDQFGLRIDTLSENNNLIDKSEEKKVTEKLIETSSFFLNETCAEPVRYARGGNGIFGQPLSETQKGAASNYRKELMKQIEERKKREEERKKREAEEEQRELEKIATDQKIMQDMIETEKLKHAQRYIVQEQTIASVQTVDSIKQLPTPQHSKTNSETLCIKPVEPLRHNVSLQTNPPPFQRRKPERCTRKVEVHRRVQPFLNSYDLLTQLNRLKAELTAAKLRINHSNLLPEQTVQVFDPRSVFRPLKSVRRMQNKLQNSNVFIQTAPARVNRRGRSYQHKLVLPPIQSHPRIAHPISQPQQFTISARLPIHVDRRRNSLESIQIDSSSVFMDNKESLGSPLTNEQDLLRTPSLDSLHLDELNRRNQKRLQRLGEEDTNNRDDNTVLNRFVKILDTKNNI